MADVACVHNTQTHTGLTLETGHYHYLWTLHSRCIDTDFSFCLNNGFFLQIWFCSSLTLYCASAFRWNSTTLTAFLLADLEVCHLTITMQDKNIFSYFIFSVRCACRNESNKSKTIIIWKISKSISLTFFMRVKRISQISYPCRNNNVLWRTQLQFNYNNNFTTSSAVLHSTTEPPEAALKLMLMPILIATPCQRTKHTFEWSDARLITGIKIKPITTTIVCVHPEDLPQ